MKYNDYTKISIISDYCNAGSLEDYIYINKSPHKIIHDIEYYYIFLKASEGLKFLHEYKIIKYFLWALNTNCNEAI